MAEIMHYVALNDGTTVTVTQNQCFWLQSLLHNSEEWRYVPDHAYIYLLHANQNNGWNGITPETGLVEFRLTDQINFIAAKGYDARLTKFGFRIALELATPEKFGHFSIKVSP